LTKTADQRPPANRVLRIAVVGNSHAVTLIEGSREIAGHLPVGVHMSFIAQIDGGQFVESHRWFVTLSAAGFERREWQGTLTDVVTQSDLTHLFILWRGNQLSIRATLLDGPEFDVVLPSDLDRPPDPGVEVIPCSVFQTIVRTSLANDRDLGDLISTSHRSGAHLWMLAPPPLLPDQAVRDRLTQQPQFVARLSQLGLAPDEVRLVPSRVRARLRSLLLDVYSDFAAEQGVGFIPPPMASSDDAGMLLPEYWGPDVTHGNAAYGAAYLRELLRVAGADDSGI
jgi:hypothetical protein